MKTEQLDHIDTIREIADDVFAFRGEDLTNAQVCAWGRAYTFWTSASERLDSGQINAAIDEARMARQ